jgi:3-phosphoshikimate 1-carboxyvinyltransferase
LSGLKNINLKESNRLDILIAELSKFTTVEKHTNDSITIHKRTNNLPESFHFDSHNDHRFVMAWSLFKNYGTVNIQNPECIKKSYPEFM